MMSPNILFVNLLSLPYLYLEQCLKGESRYDQELVMPKGILYLSASVKARNRAARIHLLDYVLGFKESFSAYSDIRHFVQGEAEKYRHLDPNIVAISLMFSSSHRFFDLVLETLKGLWPGAVTVAGGVHATNCTRTLLRHKDLDCVVRGEGEVAFPEVVEQLCEGREVKVKGVYHRGNITATGSLELADHVTHLDSLPFPHWELLDTEPYMTSGGWERDMGDALPRSSATVLTTRGCPHKCTYCSAHTVHGRKVRYRSVENVMSEMALLHKRYGVNLFVPEDDYFTANKGRVLGLLREIRKLGIPNLEMQFTGGININSMDEDILENMIGVGTKMLTLALESGSPFVQKHIIKKNVDLDKTRDLIRLCREKGIITRCNVIFGFPGETRELMEEGIEYVKGLGADWYAVLIAAPLIGSEMYNQFLKRGCLKEDVYQWSRTGFQERTFDTEEISALELKELVYRVNLDVNFVNNINLRNGNYQLAVLLFKDVVRNYPFHIFGWHGLYRALRAMGDSLGAARALRTMWERVESDNRSKEMYLKYHDLMHLESCPIVLEGSPRRSATARS